MSATAVLTTVAARIGTVLLSRGFVRKGLKYVRASTNISIIELQRARTSDEEQLRFVINFGVVVPSLSEVDDYRAITYTDCHWGGRVLDLDGIERWWSVRANDDVGALSAKLVKTLVDDVLPALDTMQSADAFISLWQTGKGPLLAPAQRLLLLGKLLYNAGRVDELNEVVAELECVANDAFSRRALDTLRRLTIANE